MCRKRLSKKRVNPCHVCNEHAKLKSGKKSVRVWKKSVPKFWKTKGGKKQFLGSKKFIKGDKSRQRSRKKLFRIEGGKKLRTDESGTPFFWQQVSKNDELKIPTDSHGVDKLLWIVKEKISRHKRCTSVGHTETYIRESYKNSWLILSEWCCNKPKQGLIGTKPRKNKENLAEENHG